MAFLVTSLLGAACGQVDPVLLPVSMPECVYQGASSMHEGNARVSLTLNGLGSVALALVEITDDMTYDDLADHLETRAGSWETAPGWVATELELSLDDAQGLDGVDETVTLDPGSYALVCIDHPYGDGAVTARVAASLEVTPG